MDRTELIQTAMARLPDAYAPYSGFHVAAALLCQDGTVFTGHNIENASYSATVCAERAAFFQAVSAGQRDFKEIVICGGKDGKIRDYCAPCGICRQVMREFCRPEFEIILAKSSEDYRVYTLAELLPVSFGPDHLNDSGAED